MDNDDDSANLPDPQEALTVNEITERFKELRQRREEMNQAFIRWIPQRRHTMEQLDELAKKLKENHRNVNISTVTGASMGTVGGILSIAGLITAPFTFGAGLIVTLVGAGIGGTGGLVMAGTKIAEVIVSKVGVNAVQQAIAEDTDACIALQQQLDELESFISDLAVFLKPLLDDALMRDTVMRELEGSGFQFLHGQFLNMKNMTSSEEKVDFGARFFRIIMSAASVTTGAVAAAGAVARGVAMAGTRAAHIAGSVVGAALLPLDIVLLVKSSIELHRGSTSKAVEEIKTILDELECPDENDIEELLKRFIDERFKEACNRINDEEEQPGNDEDHDQNNN